MPRFVPTLCWALLAGSAVAAPPDAGSQFEKKVRPLLAEKCWVCHNDKKQKGDLRLDSLAAMLKGGESGPAIVPGKPEQSLLVAALKHTEQLKMPPKNKLPDADIAVLTEWVKAGAVWPDAKAPAAPEAKPSAPRPFTAEEKAFWAFQPVRVVPAKAVSANPIDAYLRDKLDAAKLTVAPMADKRTLIRRLAFDLTGLPPTMAEVEAFVNDATPDAWDKLIERLLASPAYGEKWGRRWLDVARYADSNGMDENLAHANAWRYRDYVIRSFNADKPYDQFVKEQVAGDLLPDGTAAEKADRLTGTGFLVIGPKMLAEDDPMKMRMDIIDEQLDTLGQAFLGLTLGCARCHDHKFDPITAQDYYALAGIFYSTKTMQHYNVVARWHERPIGSPESVAKLAEYEKQRAAAADAVRTVERKLRDALKARLEIERQQSAAYADAALETVRRRGPLALVAADPAKLKGSVVVEAENYTRGNALKLTDGYGAGIGVIINAGPTPNVAEYDVDVPADGTYQVALRYAAASARPTQLSVGGKLLRTDAAGAVTGSWYPEKQAWFAEAAVELKKGKTTIRLECPGAFPHFDKLALLPLMAEQAKAVPQTAEQIAAAKKLLPSALAAWAKLAEKWNGKLPEKEELARIAADPKGPFAATPALEMDVDAGLATELRKAKDAVAALDKARPPADEVMAVEDDKAQNLRVHLRGNHLTLGAEVPRRFPAIFGGDAPTLTGSGRLQLAEWIASPNNPLTARVMANRVWLGHFGTGLVRSPDNFGRLGERPTHPELLDFLAAEFVKSGWSVKHLHRLIVKSAAYRMGTQYDAAKFRADPENRLYWRFNRRRLDAEEQRDGMLAVAGVLDRSPGGTLLTTANRAYVTSTASKAYDDFAHPRRSVYLPIIRSAVYDVLQANDFPDPSTPAGQRPTTTVPAQALFLLNSKLADQTSEAFAKSLLTLKADDAARVREAYRRALTRPATEAEVTRAVNYLHDSGDQVRAWQGLCRVLLASAEFAFVE